MLHLSSRNFPDSQLCLETTTELSAANAHKYIGTFKSLFVLEENKSNLLYVFRASSMESCKSFLIPEWTSRMKYIIGNSVLKEARLSDFVNASVRKSAF